ncbi:amidohydrolase [Virgibacillus halophilus]|uniref:Amidohydrolase n=1 Tax=Tigheibacillus halophilus TaxID=361280 RepID=A0ABU5C2H0_9BACI|nr:amidohydrolase [Virgibacillus halophilus]
MKTADLEKQLITWRRDLHQHPETGFLEMRTASIVAAVLNGLGYELQLGKAVMSAEDCMGKPDEVETKKHLDWALSNGAKNQFIDYFSQGYTGIVATMETHLPGPTIAYRFDMDALPIHETDDADHIPLQEGFRSQVPGKMHACGHDTHTAIGLGLATLIAENKQHLRGNIKLIFQPAEEGTRGAKSMAKAGVVQGVDYFIASHIGTGVPHRHFVAANNGFMATSKLDITFKGTASHAGSHPEEGKNALLAAASATLNMYAIARHSGGLFQNKYRRISCWIRQKYHCKPSKIDSRNPR